MAKTETEQPAVDETQLSVMLPTQLHRDLKVFAAATGRTLTDIVIPMLTVGLAKANGKKS